MALVGIHVSSAGSIVKTFQRAKYLSAECFQFFLRSPRTWRWKGLSEEEEEKFLSLRNEWNTPIVVHAPYLINLASNQISLRERSIYVFLEELKTCDRLKVDYYNFHPGSAKDTEEGIKTVIKSLETIFNMYEPKFTKVLVENTAGERGDIGKSVEELKILVSPFEGMGVCIDTCHTFAYGYDISNEAGFDNFKMILDRGLGLEKVKIIHANDSKVPLGGKKDRHEHIGYGYIGLRGFEILFQDDYFSTLPYYLETPDIDDWDSINIRTLKSVRDCVISQC